MERRKKMKISGKEYMLVNERVAIFRNTYPTWSLPTCIEELKDGFVVFKATVIDENGNIRATGHAYEKENSTFINKTSYIENCETSAVGRALGFLGIGIDGSIATAEEVQNAMLQQSDGEDVGYEEKISDTMANRITNILKLDKTAEQAVALGKELCKEFGVKKISELKNGQYPDVVKWLEGK
jgi:hypothetical protein